MSDKYDLQPHLLVHSYLIRGQLERICIRYGLRVAIGQNQVVFQKINKPAMMLKAAWPHPFPRQLAQEIHERFSNEAKP